MFMFMFAFMHMIMLRFMPMFMPMFKLMFMFLQVGRKRKCKSMVKFINYDAYTMILNNGKGRINVNI